jgi:hypothetical protein
MRRIAILLSIGWLLNACAFTDVPLTLPTSGFEHTASGGNGRQVIVAMPFSDQREIRDRCGMKKNGYNQDTADALCESDPNIWIAKLLADELRAAGFTVLEDDGDHPPNTLLLNGSLIKLFVEPVIGMWSGSLEADLSVTLRAKTATGLEAERTFFVKGWKGGVIVVTTQPYLTALHRATQALLDEMVAAVLELMDRYPQLGSRDPRTNILALQIEETGR